MENVNSNNLNKTASKAGLGYVIGNLILKGCVFLTLPLFTRFLSTDDFGIYNLYVAYESIVTAIVGLGVYGTVKNAKLKFEQDFNKYISSSLFLTFFISLLFLLFINVTYDYLNDFFRFSRLVLNCLILHGLGSAIIQIYGCKLNIEFKYKSYLLISGLNTFANIGISLLLIVFVFPNEKYLGRILGTAIPIILIGLALFIICVSKGKTIGSKTFYSYALRLGLPLVPHVISQSLLSQFDRIMIVNIVGESESGIYSFVYIICTIMVVIASSLDSAWTPWVYLKKHSNEDGDIKKVANYYVLLFAMATLGFVCIMFDFGKILGSEDYWNGLDLLIPLSLASYFTFLYFLPVNLEYFNNKTLFISIGTVFAALLNVGLNYIFIPLFGYKAAAYTTLASYFILFFLHCLISIKYGFLKTYNAKNIFLISLILIVCMAILLLVNEHAVISLIVRYSFVLGILILLVVLRKKLLCVFKGK